MDTITIEQVEALANTLDQETEEKRDRLMRLIRAEARIAANRAPKSFGRMATEYSDADGHWDNSYPPEQEYKDHSGPRLLEILDEEWSTAATSSGFYHDWRAVSDDLGLYVSPRGDLYGCEVSGEGHFGQFAAHPGNCGVRLSLDWVRLDPGDVSLDRLAKVETALRVLAFPASVGQDSADA